MMAQENNQLISNPPTSGQVALPYNEEQFKDFITSLLGKPQTITKGFLGSFEINKDTLITFFEVLNQRIFQQNNSQLIQFRATIYYNDNSAVTLNDFEHLVNYNEKLPLVSTAVHLTWQYLVKFRDKSSFEKQEISISFLTISAGTVAGTVDDEYFAYSGRNRINIRIAHTARTWGADIEALLSKHIDTLVSKDSKLLSFFRYNPEKIEHFVSGILISITLIFAISKTNILPDTIGAIDLIKHYGNLLFLFSGVFVLLKFTMVLLDEYEVYGRPAFILLTPESEKNKLKELKAYKREWIRYFGTIIISIVLGVASNYLFQYLAGS